jgi:hypothetical protein
VLRRPKLRGALLEALVDVDRLVLLGDTLELRHGPPREALAAARGLFEDLGRVLAGRELVIVPGNHDHALVEPWLAGRAEAEDVGPLGVEQVLEPSQASPMAERIASLLGPAVLRVAYPGLWVRPGVYATHGHYLDSHLTVPTLERLSLGVMSRVLGSPASGFSSVDDYEAVFSPPFAWRDAVARSTRPGGALSGMATADAWRALGGPERGTGATVPRRRSLARRLRTRALVVGFPLAVAVLNRAGIGELRAEVSTDELRRAGLRAMEEVASRLRLGDAQVVFGHTHRPGPLAGDDPDEWGRLINTGSWSYSPIFLRARAEESPYWPGTGVIVESSGPPRVISLLGDRGHADLREPPA